MGEAVNDIRLVVREDTLRRSGTLVAGQVWIDFGSIMFPTPGWYDLVLPVLRFWVTNLVALLSGRQHDVTIPFMDGPFAVRVRRLDATTLELAALDNEREVVRLVAARDDLARSVRDAAQRVLESSRAKGLWDRDAEELQRELPGLSGLLQH